MRATSESPIHSFRGKAKEVIKIFGREIGVNPINLGYFLKKRKGTPGIWE
jgi:hypothetical protein